MYQAGELMKTKERITLQTILIAIILIVSIGYALFIKPNYYKFNGGKMYLEPIYSESFTSNNTYEIYVYEEFLYYSSKNGLKKMTKDKESVWDKTYNLDNPKLYAENKYIAVVDMGGKLAYLFDEGGLLQTFEVEAPIILADINEQGSLILVQEKEGKHVIQYYTKKGTLLAERGTNYSTDGYPIGVDLSGSGENLATSYLSVKEGITTSTITIFSFGNEENKNPENILGGFVLEKSIVPEVKFLDDTHLVAVGDNAINFYSIKEIPKLETQIVIKNEINHITYVSDKIVVNYGKAIEVSKDSLEHTINVYSKEGEKLDAYKVPDDVSQLIGLEDYYYLITPKTISFYNINKRIWEANVSKEAKNVLRIDKDQYLVVFKQGYQILEVKDI